MKILVAPDKLKGTLTSAQATVAIERGLRKILPSAQILLFPMADGGEGTVDVLVSAGRGRKIYCQVTGPLGEPVKAHFGLLPGPGDDSRTKAVLEMSAASGLQLVPLYKRNPLLTTTYGTGELIKAALDHDPIEIIVGIGGSATVDGGMGMAQALGVKFFGENGKQLGLGGQELEKIRQIDVSGLDDRLARTKIIVATDVRNPLCGDSGAAYVYGPQKGATPEMVKQLDNGLRRYAQEIKDKLGKEVSDVPGAGAAGGLGAGLIAFLDAALESGIEVVIKATNFATALEAVDLVITGEGKIDEQTAFGKVLVGVAELAKAKGVPVYAICGQKGEGADAVYGFGIDKIFALTSVAKSAKDARENAAFYVEKVAEDIARRL